MIIDVALQSEPLHLEGKTPDGCGSVVRFEGRVRPDENGAQIAALVYEAYLPMAQAQMEKILAELAQKWPCQVARVRHRTGIVPVGEAAIIIEVFSGHRAEAFALATAFMDRLKQDVPIWKLKSIPASP
jgi:molybdopterin synthase catalytic subunit